MCDINSTFQHIYLHSPRGRGYSVQKTLRECATNMGSKIRPLGIWMTPYKMQNLVCEWVNFSTFSQNLSQNWLKFKEILEKSGDFAWNVAKKLSRLVYEWVTFSWKIGICMDLLSKRWHIPTKTKLEYPPGHRQQWAATGKCWNIESAICYPWEAYMSVLQSLIIHTVY